MKKENNKIWNWVFKSGILVFLCLIFTVNIWHFNYKMNADLASEAILGRLIWDSGQLIPDSWYPSTEARIIATPNIAGGIYGLVNNMTLAMGMACCVMAVLILISVFYCIKQTGFEGNKISFPLLGFLLLIFPVSYTSLELLYLFAGYYAIHVVLFFVTAGTYAHFLRKERFILPRAIVCFGFSLIMGMQGARGILIIYAPLLIIELIRVSYKFICCERKEKADRYIGLWVCGLVVINYIGMKCSFSVEQNISRNIRKGFVKFIEVVLPDIKEVLGFSAVGIIGKICIVLLLMAAIVVMSGIASKMFKKRQVSVLEWIYLLLCTSLIVTELVVAFTTVESSIRYYFVLLLIVPLAVTMIWGELESEKRIGVAAIILILAFVNIYSVYLPIIRSEEPPTTDIYLVGEYLEENQYNLAYATFENANTITVLENGKIQVVPVASVGKMDICKWLSSTEWYPPEVSRDQVTAYVITETEISDFISFVEGKKIKEVEKIGKYHIFVSDYNYANLQE